MSPKRRRVFSTRRVDDQEDNLFVHQTQSHNLTIPLPPKNPAFSGPVSSLLLRPCHICHRRPTTRAVLDGYTDCKDCGKRACFICMRECENERCRYAEQAETGEAVNDREYYQRRRARTRRICSSCAVETISEGYDMVTCLDCHLYESGMEACLRRTTGADRITDSSMIFDGVSDNSSSVHTQLQ